jgi:hypothetical protein
MVASCQVVPKFMTGEDKENRERIRDAKKKIFEIKWIAVQPLHAGNGQREKRDYEKGSVKKNLSQIHNGINSRLENKKLDS